MFGAVYLWFGVICKSSLVLFCLIWCYLQVIFGAVSLWSGVIYLQVIFGAVYLWSGVVICKSFLVLFLFVLVLSANYRLATTFLELSGSEYWQQAQQGSAQEGHWMQNLLWVVHQYFDVMCRQQV
ncbi:hypothetical protein PS6_011755 [Mucor atramentarius]